MELKAPAEPEDYDQFEVDGFQVWVENSVRVVGDTLRFDFDAFLHIKKILPKGIKLSLGRGEDIIR